MPTFSCISTRRFDCAGRHLQILQEIESTKCTKQETKESKALHITVKFENKAKHEFSFSQA